MCQDIRWVACNSMASRDIFSIGNIDKHRRWYIIELIWKEHLKFEWFCFGLLVWDFLVEFDAYVIVGKLLNRFHVEMIIVKFRPVSTEPTMVHPPTSTLYSLYPILFASSRATHNPRNNSPDSPFRSIRFRSKQTVHLWNHFPSPSPNKH